MHAMRIRLRMGKRSNGYRIAQNPLILGRSKDCNLRVPLAFLQNHHLIIDRSQGVTRVRACDPEVKAFVDSEQLGTTWMLIPAQASIVVYGGDEPLEILLQDEERHVSPVLLVEGDPHRTASNNGLRAQPVTQDREYNEFINSVIESNEPSCIKKYTGIPSRATTTAKARITPRRRAVLAAVCVLGLIVSALAWYSISQSRRSSELTADSQFVEAKIQLAKELLSRKDYPGAEAALEAAKQVAERRPSLKDLLQAIERLEVRPEIVYGAKGYRLMEGQWLPGELAQAWQEARERDDPKIEALYAKAKDFHSAKRWNDGRIACEEALAIMDAEPVKPHPRHDDVQSLRDSCHNEAVAGEMIAKGLVLYNNRWMTPQEKFRIEQQEKGLVEYRGKWMTKEDAFAAEQTDKGLVLYNGRWMTPDQRLIAQGYVQFEGQWIKPEQKAAILAQRKAVDEQRRAEEQRRRQEEAQVEALKQDAYEMSKVFVKKILKAPTSAQFQDYNNREVIVVYKDGWFLVSAPVDAQNSFGAMLRNSYLCKLRPISNNRWEAELTTLLN